MFSILPSVPSVPPELPGFGGPAGGSYPTTKSIVAYIKSKKTNHKYWL